MQIRVATVNIAGGARGERADPQKFELLATVLNGVDLIGLQEVIRVTASSADDVIRDDIAMLTAAPGLSGYQHFFFPQLDSFNDPDPRKWSSPVFNEYYDRGDRIQTGTGIMIAPQHAFCHLLQHGLSGHGSGQIVPWYADPPTFYRGNRDTEPRSLLIARVRMGSRFALFCCTQLATLREENPRANRRAPTPNAVNMRKLQTKWIAGYLGDYRISRQTYPGEENREPDPIILVGDFNAEPGAKELQPIEQLGLETTDITSDGIQYTHRTHKIFIDLIFAPTTVTNKTARIIDLGPLEDEVDLRISDHHPVIAEMDI